MAGNAHRFVRFKHCQVGEQEQVIGQLGRRVQVYKVLMPDGEEREDKWYLVCVEGWFSLVMAGWPPGQFMTVRPISLKEWIVPFVATAYIRRWYLKDYKSLNIRAFTSSSSSSSLMREK